MVGVTAAIALRWARLFRPVGPQEWRETSFNADSRDGESAQEPVVPTSSRIFNTRGRRTPSPGADVVGNPAQGLRRPALREMSVQ